MAGFSHQPPLVFGDEIDGGKPAIEQPAPDRPSKPDGRVRDAIAAMRSPRREIMHAYCVERYKTDEIAV